MPFILDKNSVFPHRAVFFSNLLHSPLPVFLGFNITTNPP